MGSIDTIGTGRTDAAPQGTEKHVILVEDEVNIAEAIRFLLSQDGWRVETLANGQSAFEVIRRAMPQLVILDVMLPGRSGFEILHDLRADPACAALPILMLTARGQARDREMALKAGVSRFMTKPFSNAEMLDAVRALTDESTGQAPAQP